MIIAPLHWFSLHWADHSSSIMVLLAMLCTERDIWSVTELATIVSIVLRIQVMGQQNSSRHKLARFGPLIGIS